MVRSGEAASIHIEKREGIEVRPEGEKKDARIFTKGEQWPGKIPVCVCRDPNQVRLM